VVWEEITGVLTSTGIAEMREANRKMGGGWDSADGNLLLVTRFKRLYTPSVMKLSGRANANLNHS